MTKYKNHKVFIASKNDEGRTLIKFLIKMLDNVPISRIYKLLRKKDIKINDKRVNNHKIIIKTNDNIWIYGLENIQKKYDKNHSKIKFSVNYEDENILVVEKPINISIHDEKNSLDNQVLKYLNFKKQDSFTPSHIHRIDKVTSGLVMYGKNYLALRSLKSNIHHFEKKYLFKSDLNKSLTVTKYLQHDETKHKVVESKTGKKSITKFIVNNKRKIAVLKTGHKHQIRATLEIIGFPIYGDKKYNGIEADRVYLHAYEITLHNLDGQLSYLNNKTFKSKVNFN